MDGIKVRDVADASLAAPDLALPRSIPEGFGMSVALGSGEDAFSMRAAGPRPFARCLRLGPPAFLGAHENPCGPEA